MSWSTLVDKSFEDINNQHKWSGLLKSFYNNCYCFDTKIFILIKNYYIFVVFKNFVRNKVSSETGSLKTLNENFEK